MADNRTGKLTLAEISKGMPPGDSLTPGYPVYWQDIERLVLTYPTDLDACIRLCPEFLDVDPSATARIIFYNFPFSTVGPYCETSLQFKVFFEGEPYWYELKNIVNGDAGLALGREVLGIPKKYGWTTWGKSSERGIEIEVGRGSRIPILSASFLPVRPTELKSDVPSISVRVIPAGDGPSADITLFNSQDPETSTFSIGEGGYVYEGRGSLAFHALSAIDPWHEFQVRGPIEAEYLGGQNSFTIGYGTVLKRF